MALESGLYKVVQGSFNQGNAMFGETADIQCACMALFAISYSTLKEVNRWDQFDLDIILINGDALYKSLHRKTLLTVEDLPRDFKMGEETVFAQFQENKYGIFNWGFDRSACYSFRKFSSKPRKSINFVNFFYSRNVFCNNTIHFSLLHF